MEHILLYRLKINPVFYDNSTNMVAAWYKVNHIIIDNIHYNIYRTQNNGLGKIEWKIKNKNI